MGMPTITIYSTKTCAYCHMLKNYLDSKNIGYDVKMADDDPKIAQELYDQSGQLGVPFTIIQKEDGEEARILGFDKPQIDSALDIR